MWKQGSPKETRYYDRPFFGGVKGKSPCGAEGRKRRDIPRLITPPGKHRLKRWMSKISDILPQLNVYITKHVLRGFVAK